MKAKVLKILQQKYSRTENVYYRIWFRLETGEFAMTDAVPTYRNFAFWDPVIKSGSGTIIGGVFLKEGWGKTKKIDADSQVFIIQKTLIKDKEEPKLDTVYRVRVGNPEIWVVNGTKQYEITILNGFTTCTCEAFKFAGKRKTCKHIRQVNQEQVQLHLVEQAKIPTLF